MRDSLESTLPEETIGHPCFDSYIFCQFAQFDQFSESLRSQIVLGDRAFDEALARTPVVFGHFPLEKLLRLAPPSNIATVLREPRARILSMYMFIRLSTVFDDWGTFREDVLEAAGPSIGASLTDPRISPLFDNLICRLVLHGDPRIPDIGFIAPTDIEGIAKSTLAQLDRLGYMGLLEWDDIWSDLSTFFGVSLSQLRSNVTGADGIRKSALPIPYFDMEELLELIDQRSAADQIVYATLLRRKCGDDYRTERITTASFAAQLMRFGDLTGSSAVRLSELEAHRDHLEGLVREYEKSRSWKMTRWVRAMGQRVRGWG